MSWHVREESKDSENQGRGNKRRGVQVQSLSNRQGSMIHHEKVSRSIRKGKGRRRKLLVLLLTHHHDGAGVTTSKKAAVGLIVVCVVLVWAVFPIFIESPDYVLALTVNPSTNSDCPAGSACFTMELGNRGPWPVTIELTELQVYPSLIGPSLNVNWLGSGPGGLLVLIPFTGHTYTFWIKIMGGLRPPDRVYVILTANVTVLYISHYFVLHSGKR